MIMFLSKFFDRIKFFKPKKCNSNPFQKKWPSNFSHSVGLVNFGARSVGAFYNPSDEPARLGDFFFGATLYIFLSQTVKQVSVFPVSEGKKDNLGSNFQPQFFFSRYFQECWHLGSLSRHRCCIFDDNIRVEHDKVQIFGDLLFVFPPLEKGKFRLSDQGLIDCHYFHLEMPLFSFLQIPGMDIISSTAILRVLWCAEYIWFWLFPGLAFWWFEEKKNGR